MLLHFHFILVVASKYMYFLMFAAMVSIPLAEGNIMLEKMPGGA
jgi:hypothetical protein